MLKMRANYFFYIGYIFRKLKKAFTLPSVAVEYPFVFKPLPALSHTSLKNDFSECTGCLQCEDICPVGAIEIQGVEYSSFIRRPTTSHGVPFERELDKYQIDYTKCVLCGLCVQICPTNSLTFSKSSLKPEFNAKNLVVDLVHVPRSMRRDTRNEN